MRSRALAVLVLVLAVAALAPTAQAKELQANVVSVQSRLTPGEPVPVVFELDVLNGSAATQPVAGAVDPAVVLTGNDETRRFPAVELGGGRYAAEIVFPSSGGWELNLAVGDLAPVQLGKGAVRIDAAPSAFRDRLPALPLMLAGAALLAFLHVRSGRS